jgi:hypothetical protein
MLASLGYFWPSNPEPSQYNHPVGQDGGSLIFTPNNPTTVPIGKDIRLLSIKLKLIWIANWERV